MNVGIINYIIEVNMEMTDFGTCGSDKLKVRTLLKVKHRLNEWRKYVAFILGFI